MWNLSVCAKSLIARWSRKCTKFCAKRKSRRISKPGIGGTENIRKKSRRDRKSTRLNSSHLGISYAVFCLKKKNKRRRQPAGQHAASVRLVDGRLELAQQQTRAVLPRRTRRRRDHGQPTAQMSVVNDAHV